MDALMNAPVQGADLAWCIPADSAVGRLILQYDWAATPLGPLPTWPISLQVALSIALHSRFPMMMWLGKELRVVYNDAFAPNLGARHPSVLGLRGGDAFPEAWHVCGPELEEVLATGKATWRENHFLLANTHGYLEESYWTYSFSPLITQTGEVVGIFDATKDTTLRRISERRLDSLHQLSARTAAAGTSAMSVSQTLVDVFSRNPNDLPFSMVYLADETGRELRLTHSHNVSPNQLEVPAAVACGDGPQKHLTTTLGASLQVLAESRHLYCMDIPVPAAISLSLPNNIARPESLVLLPLRAATDRAAQPLLGVLVLGVNAHKRLDDNYRRFHAMLASTATAALLASRDNEREKRKTEALAALDRAKTTFFQDISHEFRTPLTLILGPLDDLLHQSAHLLSQHQLETLQVVQRNGARLLKLVNALLDFARIEAGRVVARYVPTDLAHVTVEHASLFRAACERAGLAFEVDCPSLHEPVYVDREMWEKIVINLLSNAFKYTLKGRIRAALRETERGAEFSVSDTGCGIPAQEQARVFDRFYRVRSSKGRTEEGSGIGLALLHELVKMHGGSVALESVEGRGSTFRVTIPFGSSHLPPDQVAASSPTTSESPSASHPRAKLDWWAEEQSPELLPLPKRARTSDGSACVLVVDDNPDMLAYIGRILIDGGYDVLTARDGQAALELIERGSSVDLVVSDGMTPRMDGKTLVRTLRNSRTHKYLPVILVTARAGEEESSDGLAAGADDYLVKPFSSRELVARVSARLELARVRMAAAQQELQLREAAEQANATKDLFIAVLSHELRTPLTPALMLAEAGEHDPSLPENVRADMALIAQNLRLEVDIISDLLDLTKIRQHKLVLAKYVLDLHSVLRSSAELLKPQMQEKNLHFELELKAPVSWVTGDSTRLQQVFWNLLGNAVKFTPEHGTVRLLSQQTNNGEGIEVSVVDSGIGLEMDQIPRLFNAFEQGNHRVFGGLGLGLSIAKSLVDLHEGTITASSPGKGQGATFSVTLPVTAPPSAEIAALTRSRSLESVTAHGTSKLRVLVVEDNTSSLIVLARMLERLGCRTQKAATVAEATAVLSQSEPIDVLICDIGLPDGTGLEVMTAAKRLQPAIRGFALSGFGTKEDMQKSMEAGFSRHLVKPVRFRDIQELVCSLHPA